MSPAPSTLDGGVVSSDSADMPLRSPLPHAWSGVCGDDSNGCLDL